MEIVNKRKLGCIVVNPAAELSGSAPAILYADAIKTMPDTLPDVDIGSDDLAQIMYTSGTTGRQKGVMHSHASVYAALMSNIAELGANSNDVSSCIFPMFHVSQHVVSMTFWVVGAAVHLDRSFDVDKFLQAVQSSRITVMVALPMMYGAILNHPQRSAYDLTSLRLCIYAMAPMSQPMLMRLIDEICPNFALCSGQTEMYSITTMFKPEEQLRRFGPYWGISAYVNETAIMDDEEGCSITRRLARSSIADRMSCWAITGTRKRRAMRRPSAGTTPAISECSIPKANCCLSTARRT
jgi:long-chain acyl-CoA synthetase